MGWTPAHLLMRCSPWSQHSEEMPWVTLPPECPHFHLGGGRRVRKVREVVISACRVHWVAPGSHIKLRPWCPNSLIFRQIGIKSLCGHCLMSLLLVPASWSIPLSGLHSLHSIASLALVLSEFWSIQPTISTPWLPRTPHFGESTQTWEGPLAM